MHRDNGADVTADTGQPTALEQLKAQMVSEQEDLLANTIGGEGYIESAKEGEPGLDLSMTKEEVQQMLSSGLGEVLNALQLFAVIHLLEDVQISRSLVKAYYTKNVPRKTPMVNLDELGIERRMFKKGLPSELRIEINARIKNPQAIEYFSYLPFVPKSQNLCNADDLQSLIHATVNAIKYMSLAATTNKEKVEDLLQEEANIAAQEE